MLIGCNYTGTKAELKGCINDVKKMHRCLINRYGFSEGDIKVLIDTDESYTQPAGRNIRTALSDLIKSADSGDFLFVHYSGHGTRLPAETGENDDTGYDECIVPCDMNLITGMVPLLIYPYIIFFVDLFFGLFFPLVDLKYRLCYLIRTVRMVDQDEVPLSHTYNHITTVINL